MKKQRHRVSYGIVFIPDSQKSVSVLTSRYGVRQIDMKIISTCVGYAVAQLVEVLRHRPEGRGLSSRWSHCNFLFTSFFRQHYGAGIDSASNRNKDHCSSLGVKAAGA